MRWFAVPLSLVAQWRVKRNLFNDLTGRGWDEWTLDLQPTVQGRERIESRLWSSASGVVSVELLNKTDTETRVRVALTDLFQVEGDYLVLERRWLTPRGDETGKWRVNLIAGVMPDWGIFGWAWKAWVNNQRVVDSAISHILENVPQVLDEVHAAEALTLKDDIAEAWHEVANEVEIALDIDIGGLKDQSMTAVQGMPIRIASKIGNWTPPDESGRILVADVGGIFPTEENILSGRY